VETEFTRWFQEAMDRRGIIQSQVAAYAGVSSAAVSRWATGKSRPDPEYVRRLAELFQEPLHKLYALAGHPSEYTPPERQPLSLRNATVEFLAELPIEVPVYEQLASAGEGQAAVLDRIFLPPHRGRRDRLFGLRVRGTSMEPEIRDGDTLVIDPDATARDGDTVVGSVGDETFVKTLRQKSDHFVLQGTNGKVVQAADATIAGVVIQVVRDVPRG